MGIRPANRAIETFDISLMAVVTKAMGAFLVLMLLLVPSYVAMPDMQRRLAGDEAASRALERDSASLANENRALETADPSRAQALRQRIAALERENQQLAQRSGYPALLIFFNSADCDADVDFYVAAENADRADAGAWPDVRPGRQELPAAVFEYPPAQLAHLLFDLVDPEVTKTHFIARRAAKERLWVIKAVHPNSRYILYAKVSGLRGQCDMIGRALLTAPDDGMWRSVIAPGKSVSSSPEPYRLLVKGYRIVLIGRLGWDGKVLDWREPLAGSAPSAEQKELDARFGYRD